MPVALLVGGLVALAFAFVAIGASLLINKTVVDPLKAASAAVAEVALVGGVLAWMLSHIVQLVQYSLAGIESLVETAKRQAADTWNWLAYSTVANQFYYEWQSVHWYQSIWAQVWTAASNFPALWSLVTASMLPTLNWVSRLVADHIAWVVGTVVPKLNAVSDSLDLLRWGVNNVVWPAINGIAADLNGLHQWINANVVVRGELARAEANTLAQAQALVVPLAVAIAAIENSPCMKVCGPLGDLGQLLQGLEDAGMLAIMLELIQQARTHPDQLASEINADLGAPIRDVLSSLSLGIP